MRYGAAMKKSKCPFSQLADGGAGHLATSVRDFRRDRHAIRASCWGTFLAAASERTVLRFEAEPRSAEMEGSENEQRPAAQRSA
jgi:hypothetical protein